MTASQSSLWPAPSASAPVTAAVTVPGSKSVTNRALVLAALAAGPGRLRRPLRSRDSALMAGGLRALGVGIEESAGPDGAEEWRVSPGGGLRGDASVDVGNAGTVMRFLPPVAALADGPVRFDGDPRSHERPLHGVIDALRALGARIDDTARGSRGALPLTVYGGGGLRGGPVEVDASSSSQFVSALLLSAPRFDKGVELRHTGDRLPSMPHIRMTVEMLRAAGAEVEAPGDGGEPNVWRVAPGTLRGRDLTVEPDLSNAQPFLAAALVTGGRVTIRDWPRQTTQPGDALREIFTEMGGSCELVTTAEGTDLVFSGTPAGSAGSSPGGSAGGSPGRSAGGSPGRSAAGAVHGIDIDLSEVGELTPGIAAVAALADSPSRLRGVGHLRLHETDRLAALTAEINGLGGEVTESGDGLAIHPRPLHGGVFHTYDDHRMATAGAVLGLAVPGVRVENVETTAKTLPDFPRMWAGLLAGGDAGPAAGPSGAPAAPARRD